MKAGGVRGQCLIYVQLYLRRQIDGVKWWFGRRSQEILPWYPARRRSQRSRLCLTSSDSINCPSYHDPIWGDYTFMIKLGTSIFVILDNIKNAAGEGNTTWDLTWSRVRPSIVGQIGKTSAEWIKTALTQWNQSIIASMGVPTSVTETLKQVSSIRVYNRPTHNEYILRGDLEKHR